MLIFINDGIVMYIHCRPMYPYNKRFYFLDIVLVYDYFSVFSAGYCRYDYNMQILYCIVMCLFPLTSNATANSDS